jgi:hypothetical protein
LQIHLNGANARRSIATSRGMGSRYGIHQIVVGVYKRLRVFIPHSKLREVVSVNFVVKIAAPEMIAFKKRACTFGKGG